MPPTAAVSRSAHLMVETTAGDEPSGSDEVLDRFQESWGPAFVAGRLTVTPRRVTFVPSRAGRGMALLDLDLDDIARVEVGGGRVSTTVAMATATHLVHVRLLVGRRLATKLRERVAAERS